MASHDRRFQDISRERRVMLRDCKGYVTMKLQRLPLEMAEINEGIRVLRQILDVLDDELAIEAPPQRFRHPQMMLFNMRRDNNSTQHPERNGRIPASWTRGAPHGGHRGHFYF
ncbi:uncharacterized protein LOC127751437 isoform X2 [Frankliniella occidentalis]|uniref:Uncharacterized protein LOC127751437 isoform X2 n=1 Tax=Frankliniella occidentalis TaxID=133901 RepID=A0A9C6X8B9_FRAOC|nr:uncharacterized protein LOC127751437 isoform X2 [Frankliniella occidentalis]